MTKLYLIAEKRIRVTSLFEEVHRCCSEYLTEGEADFTVTITEEDIAFERERSEQEAILEGRRPVRPSEAYLETLAVYRKIAEQMPFYDTLLFHGSCVAVDGLAYLFTAPSGVGKSTHTRMWREYLGERAVMINDDKPLLHVSGGEVLVYGTPWNGKHRLGCNMSAPLKALCLLERAEYNRIEAIRPAAAWPMLLQQAYRPADGAALARTLNLLEHVLDKVPLYRLGCLPDVDAAKLAYETMAQRR